jgi:hypothetical protein
VELAGFSPLHIGMLAVAQHFHVMRKEHTMAFRIQYFVLFFCLLFAGGTMLFDRGNFSAGTAIGALLTAAVIAAVIKPKK